MNEKSEITFLIGLCTEINKKLEQLDSNPLNQAWLPKKVVMRFFDYGDTQLRQLEKEYKIEVSKIKARKFYSVKSLLKLIENNKI